MRTITLVLLGSFFMMAAILPVRTVQYKLTGESRMWVDGTSTIHDWTCKVGNATGTIDMDPAAPAVTKAGITVPSTAFDCENATMNKNVSSALSTDKQAATKKDSSVESPARAVAHGDPLQGGGLSA